MLDFGKRRRGVFVKLGATEVIDLVAGSGFDFAVVDLEHSQLSAADASTLVRHASVLGLPALVRLPEVDRGLVNRLLEAGAAGIQLSTVRRARQVEALRSASSYAPAGTRSISLAHAVAGYGAVPLAEYLARAPVPLIVAQIETAETDDPLDEILAAGPDVAFVGVADLTVDLGLDAGRVRTRIEEIAAAARRAGVVLGAFGVDRPDVRYDVGSSDLALLRQALRDAA